MDQSLKFHIDIFHSIISKRRTLNYIYSMKKSIVGSLIGICIIIAVDSFIRVIVSVYSGTEILMISYSSYPGIMWPVALTIFAGFSTFIGGMFALTFGRAKPKMTALTFTVLLIIIRYSQVHLLIDQEMLLYPIIAMVLSIGAIILAWNLTGGKKHKEKKVKHHQPAEDEEWNQP